MSSPDIMIITGPCGVGKTSVINTIISKLDGFEVHELDELGVPEIPTVDWRKKMTEFWIQKAIISLNEGKTFILVGLIIPQEVELNIPKDLVNRVRFLLLNLSWAERARRLNCRKESKLSVLNDRKNLEQLPAWLKESIFRYTEVDTMNLLIEETAERTLDWILKKTSFSEGVIQ